MRITRRQLRRIIREELNEVNTGGYTHPLKEALDDHPEREMFDDGKLTGVEVRMMADLMDAAKEHEDEPISTDEALDWAGEIIKLARTHGEEMSPPHGMWDNDYIKKEYYDKIRAAAEEVGVPAAHVDEVIDAVTDYHNHR
jgi:hypothetical protein